MILVSALWFWVMGLELGRALHTVTFLAGRSTELSPPILTVTPPGEYYRRVSGAEPTGKVKLGLAEVMACAIAPPRAIVGFNPSP